MSKTNVRADNGNVIINMGDREAIMSPQAARRFAAVLTAYAGEADEQANALRIIEDGAILTRAGVPIGLTSNRKMIDEIGKEAAWNRNLRRYMPGGVKSEGIVTAPTINGGGKHG